MLIFAPFKLHEGVRSRPTKAAFLLPAIFGTNKHSSTAWASGNTPKAFTSCEPEQRVVLLFYMFKSTRDMKAKVIYDLETRIRKERKRIATQNCRRWQLYYYDVTGERWAAPILTPREIKATRLPSTNNGQQAIILSL